MILSAISSERLGTCDERLQRVIEAVALRTPIIVLCGHRTKEDQDKAVHDGKSLKPWPTSRHNGEPSQAVDLATLPLTWKDIASFRALNAEIQRVAQEMDIEIEWGGNWHHPKDYDHWQLKETRHGRQAT